MNNEVLVLGDGLLGRELVSQSNWDYVSRSKDGFDIEHFDEFILSNYNVIINCIAHTDTYDLRRRMTIGKLIVSLLINLLIIVMRTLLSLFISLLIMFMLTPSLSLVKMMSLFIVIIGMGILSYYLTVWFS